MGKSRKTAIISVSATMFPNNPLEQQISLSLNLKLITPIEISNSRS